MAALICTASTDRPKGGLFLFGGVVMFFDRSMYVTRVLDISRTDYR
jgi:hypothetical protein